MLHLLSFIAMNQFRNLDCCKQHHRSTRPLLSSARERRSQSTCSSSALLIKTLPPLVTTLHRNLFRTSVDHIFLLACLPHYTSGQTYYYPAFNAGRTEDAMKFAHEFGAVLATPIMLEAVMRVRASRGKILNIFPYQSLRISNLQAFVWRPSMATSSSGLRTFWQCPLCPRTSLTLLKSRSRRQSPRLSLFSKPPFCILHVTVGAFSPLS